MAAAVLVGCGGGTTGTTVEPGAATPVPTAAGATDATQSPGPSVATSDPGGEPIVIKTSVVIAPVEGADIPASGVVLEGSTLGNEPFCVGGTIEDRHANEDPAMEPYGLLARTISCPDGTVKVAFTPEDGAK